MDVVVYISYIGLLFAVGCALVRLFRGPTLADRVMALDLMLIALMTGIAVDAVDRDDTTYLNLLVVIAVIGFTATLAVASFMERREHPEDPS